MNATLSRSSGIGWVMILLALAAVLVVANAPMPTSAPQPASVSGAAIVIVADADPLEEGEPMAAEPVGPNTIGPKAGDTYNIPGICDAHAGTHADERHGDRAVMAREAIMTGGFQRFDCKDGRTRLVKQLANKTFAFIVLDGNIEVSAFMGTHNNWDFYRKMLERDGCLPPGSPFGGALAN